MRSFIGCLLLCAFAGRAAEPPPPAPVFSLRVHLLSDDARIELRRATAGLNNTICKTPCDTDVQFHRNETFTLGGPELTTSDQIAFPARDGELTIRVHATKVAARHLGVGLIVLGAVVAGASEAYSIGGCTFSDSNCSSGRVLALGLVGLAGAGVIVAGILTLVKNRPTEATIEP